MYISEQFEVIEEIGHGGMGAVYKAKQILFDRIVAIKLMNAALLDDADSLRRFQREAKTTSLLEHPHIVSMYSYGISPDGRPYFVMEYLEGKTLSKLLEEKKTLDLESFNRIFLDLCSALSYAHEKSVIHRDIKPENIILVCSESGQESAKLLDFGIAVQLELADSQKLTAATNGTQNLIGSPGYMSPEQCRGQKLDARSDIYSLACVMYKALTSKSPFEGETAHEIMLKHLKEEAPSLHEQVPGVKLPPSLCKLIEQCLSKNPENRIQSVSELSSKLQLASRETPVALRRKFPNRILALTLGIGSFALIAILLLAIYKSGLKPAPSEPTTDWNELTREFKRAHLLDKEGKNSEAVRVFQSILRKIEPLSGKPALEAKVAALRYNCYRQMIHADQDRPGRSSKEAIAAWRQCLDAARKGFASNTSEVTDAELHLATELVLDAPSSESVLEISDLCKESIKGFESRINTLANAPLFNKKDEFEAIGIRLQDSNAILARLSDLKGNHKEAIATLKEAFKFRQEISDFKSDAVLYQQEWLCQAYHNAKMKAEEKASFQDLFKFLDSSIKFNPRARLLALSDLANFYMNNKSLDLSLQLADEAVKNMEARAPQAHFELAQVCALKAKILACQGRTKDSDFWKEKSRAEMAKL